MRVLCTTTSLRCCYCVTIVFIVVLTTSTRYRVDAFDTVVVSSSPVSTFSRTTTCSSTISLFSIPPSSPLPQRQPRRNLQKRPRKNRKTSTSGSESQQFPSTGTNDYYRSTFYSRHPSQQQQQQQQRHVMEDFPWETAESRTIISAAAREAGEDYWIDIEELQRIEEQQERLRQQRVLKSRDPNQISDQKLWIEVLSPYKQNWIGLISVSIIALAFIFKYFPEVIDPPIITNIPELL